MRETSRKVAEAFGLGRPVGVLEPFSYRSSPTWSLSTTGGRVLIKRVDADGWWDDFAAAMAFERRAHATGIAMPRPVCPVQPTLDYAVRVDGLGLVRAYEWMDGRPLDDADDVADWLGVTLARLHTITAEPQVRLDPTATPEWYRLNDAELWQGWLRDGHRLGRRWAGPLRARLADILVAAAWVERGWAAAGDHVMTHRDVEPWNVLVTGSGPVLIDWDTAGPDSARLEAAHATMVFAMRGRTEPDAKVVERTRAAYVGAGGAAFGGESVLVRRVGLRLGRLAERLRMSLGQQDAGPHDLAALEQRAVERIGGMPEFVATVRSWARML